MCKEFPVLGTCAYRVQKFLRTQAVDRSRSASPIAVPKRPMRREATRRLDKKLLLKILSETTVGPEKQKPSLRMPDAPAPRRCLREVRAAFVPPKFSREDHKLQSHKIRPASRRRQHLRQHLVRSGSDPAYRNRQQVAERIAVSS
jgi:hypothetical protein